MTSLALPLIFGSAVSGPARMPLMTHLQAAAEARSVLRVMPIPNDFAAAAEGLGLTLLAIPLALAENLVRVLPQEEAQ